MQFQPVSIAPIVHHYAPRLIALEYQPLQGFQKGTPRNMLVFIGGLSDGLRTVHYPQKLHDHLQQQGHSSWTVTELMISSSYAGWETTSNLDQDCIDVANAISYFRNLQQRSCAGGQIILMGHSTGSQISMHYCVGPWQAKEIPQSTLQRPKPDGVILQACVSDREALEQALPGTPESLEFARQWVREGRGDDHMPSLQTGGTFGGALPTARRWLSLGSRVEEEADEDYFSSDLSDERVERIWGSGGIAKRAIPIMALHGSEDGSIPVFVDKEALIQRWANVVKRAGGQWVDESGVITGAGHNLNDSLEGPIADLCSRVEAFVQSCCMETQHRST